MRTIFALLVAFLLIPLAVHSENVPATPEETVILNKLAEETLVLAEVPQGMPDPAAWDGIVGRWTAGLSHTKTAREKGNPLAIFLVAERICPDTDVGTCYVTILFEFSQKENEEQASTDNAVRYAVLSNEGKQVNGCVWAHDTEGAKKETYWVRRDGKWLQHPQGSPEHVVTRRLIGVLANLGTKIEMHIKEPQAPRKGIRAQSTTPSSGRRTFS